MSSSSAPGPVPGPVGTFAFVLHHPNGNGFGGRTNVLPGGDSSTTSAGAPAPSHPTRDPKILEQYFLELVKSGHAKPLPEYFPEPEPGWLSTLSTLVQTVATVIRIYAGNLWMRFVAGVPFPVDSQAERWSFRNTIKLVTSFAFLLPILWMHPTTVENGYAGAVTFAWSVITAGCVGHHYWPANRVLHAIDHWTIIVGIGVVMITKLDPALLSKSGSGIAPWAVVLGWYPVWLYSIGGALTYRSELYRMLLVGAGFLYLLVVIAPAQHTPDAARKLVLTSAGGVALFVAQRCQIPHAHSVWHVLAGLLGVYIQYP